MTDTYDDLPDSDLLGRRVGWLETYRTVGNVLNFRTEWGRVIKHFHHPGACDGFPFAGWYVAVIQEGYDYPLYLQDGDVVSVEGISLITEDEDLIDD